MNLLQMSIDQDHNFAPSLLSYCELLLLKQESLESMRIVETVVEVCLIESLTVMVYSCWLTRRILWRERRVNENERRR